MLTTSRRLALLVFVFLVWTPAAYAWCRPLQGPVLRPFAYDETHPYAAGQHRGVDLGAAAAGETVVAPAAGTVSFAGTVPTNGESVTIETADGYSVTLTHLGSISVSKGATVAEQDAIGMVGPSGTPEVDAPYVHLGIRVTADPNGYVDPLTLLPSAPAGDSSSPSTASSGSPAVPAKKPASSAPRSSRAATTRGSNTQSDRNNAEVRGDERVQASESDARTTRSGLRPVVRTGERGGLRAQQRGEDDRTSSIRRPLVEPTGLGVSHELRSRMPSAELRHQPSSPLLGLVSNGAAALCALGAALVASRRRRRWNASPPARVLHLPRSAAVDRHVSRAA
jgi:peptidase M23-like protein